MTKSEPGKISYRYEERHGMFDLQGFAVGPVTQQRVKYMNGPMDDRPEWLVSIVNIAKLGGWVMAPPLPPPTMILWFDVDADGELIGFLDFNDDGTITHPAA